MRPVNNYDNRRKNVQEDLKSVGLKLKVKVDAA
jgi:hypothetical protein